MQVVAVLDECLHCFDRNIGRIGTSQRRDNKLGGHSVVWPTYLAYIVEMVTGRHWPAGFAEISVSIMTSSAASPVFGMSGNRRRAP